jgi:hypothetical protein
MADNALNFGIPTLKSESPLVADPAAAIAAGNQAAASLYDLRAKQAQQKIGAILQQATGPDGVVDHQRAQALAAQAGSGVQMGMQSFLTSNSALRGAQTKQAGELHGLVGSMAASLMNDSSDENLAKIRATAVASGLPPSALAEIDRLQALDPKLRGAEAYKHVLANIDALGQLARGGYPTPKLEQFGNVASPVTTTPPTPWTPGGVNVSPNATTIGPAPGTTKSRLVPYDGQGIIPPDANGNPSRPPLGWRPQEEPVTNIPGVPSGGQPVGGGGGPGQTLPVNPTVQPNVQPGRIAPAPGSPTRNPAVAAPVVPAVPPAAAPPVVPPAPAVTTNAPAPFFTSPPQGQPETLKANQEAYRGDQAAIPTLITRGENMGHAYEALRLMKLNTGKGAQEISAIRSFLGTVGVANPEMIADNKLKEIFAKYTERAMIDAAGGASTDLGKRMQEQANAGVNLSTPANLEILRNDLGKALQSRAAYHSHDPATEGAGYLKNRADLAQNTDARGFVWSMYDEDEQRKIMAEVKGTPAEAKLHKAIGMAARLNMTIPVRPLPPTTPDRRSAIMPQMLPGPQPNALLA